MGKIIRGLHNTSTVRINDNFVFSDSFLKPQHVSDKDLELIAGETTA